MDKNLEKKLKKLDKQVRTDIARDENLYKIIEPFFTDRKETEKFIIQALKKKKTRRMILKLQCYCEMADDMEKTRYKNEVSLRIIFLFSLAEGVSRENFRRETTKKAESTDELLQEFFRKATEKDKKKLQSLFKKIPSYRRRSLLRVSSIIRILYQVRNDAVHGNEFWTFFLKDDADEFWTITEGKIGKRRKKSRKKYPKRKIKLETYMTYRDLRNIVVQTALENIKETL